ncbi:MAG TPA: Asp-tRNA(Asn)/Glu-tRNA(Gln) amidotransferase subunit GatB [Sediminibacterium sp.]|uniref:Asp-tRNA(Asn)/Glu-tRNA(Gln) amidotransferase subunit GatB n=1 Tax=Sediminibacterium sp. TaxID=1917865 RepID=UPI0008CBF21E|nr:Asp-tRNA(Asn)/Glu-tRNA(Gln) amidotransferase subunit GatB [Sediminibacterium sp.]OHC86719.1 MAG: aspartyl/glutamyl-tRNA amidotransferase subunit B [Sphingobacteriia bacterium RIFOXYC2_FULL_35_18]OHC88423.1 MAG: aspartyl/glutamyl-tRNA amidotransferase subunit B [Sphingobacteriia bacterium RIFOXYD2_FULL_35_12]HLD51922.1 Asp-tRNA(Asn)/Glu-tRNA(Gln) amidotransferase subunit GatB [Sediminibacterium sp.]
MDLSQKYQAIIGLEVHAQLSTNSKLFSGDSIAFGNAPNTQVSPIALAHPGSLPKLNQRAIEYAVKMGLACNCTIAEQSFFARKNYFYPDLPKGYQISQHTHPICIGGFVTIKTNEGERAVQLNRIHLEEDAGKSIHDQDPDNTCIDLNRAGTPLIEIVTEPDLFSAEEAWNYVTEIRKLVRWINICDGNMEEGSLRCDANISVRLRGETQLGTKVEVKNLNSIRNVKKAIEFEIDRIIEELEKGNKIQQQTRSFNADNDTTFAIRDKEEANDYRYFPDPDLPAIQLTAAYIDSIKNQLPDLPHQLIQNYQTKYQLSAYDASQLCEEKSIANFFEQTIQYSSHYKMAANWILGPIKQLMNDSQKNIQELGLTPIELANLIELIESGKINFSTAASKLLPAMLNNSTSPLELAESLNLLQVSDSNELEQWVNATIESMPDKVKEYQKGKKGLIGLFVGEVKKKSKGKADPKIVTQLLEQKLNT